MMKFSLSNRAWIWSGLLSVVLTPGFLSATQAAEDAVQKDADKPAAKKAAEKKATDKKKGRAGKAAAAMLAPAEHQMVFIPSRALGKEFLMSGSVIPQALAATSTGLAGKIVRFELYHDGVDLYESIDGLVVTKDLPARRLITTFPIVEQDDEGVVIDFNGGMRRVFNEIWYASSSYFNPSDREQVAELTQSRVFSVKREGRVLAIRQSAQVRDRQYNPNEEARYEIRYFLAPYSKGGFEGKENSVQDSRYLRFFETQVQLEPTTGRNISKIALFDLKSPIVFHYSANTPTDYEQAVRDGIEYWNRAFGREVIQARKAPKGVIAPDARHNLVQWVPWDNAGFAYADILVDPRTGRSQRGQAFMTSVFAISSKARARRLLREMRVIAEEQPKDEKGDEKDLHGHASSTMPAEGYRPLFPPSSVCRVDRQAFARQLAAGLEEVLASEELTDEAVLRISQDYVREVVAHEVGHVLGLRHNFAGSLAADLNHAELDAWFKDYLAGKDLSKYQDRLSSSSMMEYTAFKGSLFVGWKMRATDKVLPHDKAAIQWGYFEGAEAREKKMLFATDDDRGGYGDVTVFDYGVEPVLGAYSELADAIQNIPNRVIEEYIRAKAPLDPRDAVPLASVNLSPYAFISPLRSEQYNILKWFQSGTRSLRIENEFDFIGDLNKKQRIQAHWNSLTNQLARLGGVDNALFAWLPADLKLDAGKKAEDIPDIGKLGAKEMGERLAKLLEAPAYATFIGLDDKKHTFTKEEKALIRERGAKLFAEIEKKLIETVLQAFERAKRDIGLEATGQVGEKDPIASLEQRIMDLARHVILAKNEDDKLSGKLEKGLVTVVDYKYDMDTRMAAAKALGNNVGSFPNWANEAKNDIHKKLKADVESMLNIGNFKSFSESMLSRPLHDWYLKQQSLLKLLPPKKTAAPPSSSNK